VVRRLQAAGHEAYIVGGSVRDLLLGKVPKDYDVATDATPEEVKGVFPRCHLIGRRFRLAHVRLDGILVEVATFRGQQDGNTANDGRILRDNVWGSLEEDAMRRDFTINALFMDPISGDVWDFTGGFQDLMDRKLRLIGDPVTRYQEDPVRLLRAARFVAKLGVEPVPATAVPISEMAPLLENIPPARLFEEVCKLFLTGHATRTLEALQRFRLTRSLFPTLDQKGSAGQVETGEVMRQAMSNTDSRILQSKSVTPAFLFAVLLWRPVQTRVKKFLSEGLTELQAIERAGEEVISLQVKRTAIPRRFSAVTRQIWEMQARFSKTRGKRAMSVMHQPRFRAGYDFLLLRTAEEPELVPFAEFWTEAQKGQPLRPPLREGSPHKKGRRRKRYRGRNRKNSATPGA